MMVEEPPKKSITRMLPAILAPDSTYRSQPLCHFSPFRGRECHPFTLQPQSFPIPLSTDILFYDGNIRMGKTGMDCLQTRK